MNNNFSDEEINNMVFGEEKKSSKAKAKTNSKNSNDSIYEFLNNFNDKYQKEKLIKQQRKQKTMRTYLYGARFLKFMIYKFVFVSASIFLFLILLMMFLRGFLG